MRSPVSTLWDDHTVPVPAEERGRIRRWLGRDLQIVVEHLDYGFALLAVAENPYIDGLPATQQFRRLMRALEAPRRPLSLFGGRN